jgi:hypothetical protein
VFFLGKKAAGFFEELFGQGLNYISPQRTEFKTGNQRAKIKRQKKENGTLSSHF